MTPSTDQLPIIGTWKLTVCETSRPDLPYPAGGITAFAREADGLHYSNEGIWSDGRTAKVTAVLQLDGSWCPITGSLLADSLSFRQREDGSFEGRMRKGGADVGSNHSMVSVDGQTMTGHWEIAGPGGAAIVWTTTSERQ